MNVLFDRLRAETAAQDLCLVIFVHGWKNNASYDNDDVRAFRALLEELARTEAQHPPGAWSKPRKVVGHLAHVFCCCGAALRQLVDIVWVGVRFARNFAQT
jgi:hypothetical protein